MSRQVPETCLQALEREASPARTRAQAAGIRQQVIDACRRGGKACGFKPRNLADDARCETRGSPTRAAESPDLAAESLRLAPRPSDTRTHVFRGRAQGMRMSAVGMRWLPAGLRCLRANSGKRTSAPARPPATPQGGPTPAEPHLTRHLPSVVDPRERTAPDSAHRATHSVCLSVSRWVAITPNPKPQSESEPTCLISTASPTNAKANAHPGSS